MQKTSFKTRLLALLTAVFMVVVSIPFAAFADNTATLNYYCSGDANHSGHQAAEVTISASRAGVLFCHTGIKYGRSHRTRNSIRIVLS